MADPTWVPNPYMYPTADGWTPPGLPSNEEMIRAEEERDARPKKTLCKRLILVKELQVEKMSADSFMSDNGFSLICTPLVPWSRYSGEGDERGWMVYVYYEPDNETKVLTCLDDIDVPIRESEREAVDPDSDDPEERVIMSVEESIHFCGLVEHELLKEGEEPTRKEEGKYWW
eukprot:gnl/TRDRNA2_/TRDRNA2_187798_c0_seq1.p1 gnl/TRDRNA2_/TRDRNA2_187798_c0~~gnl/TRDRNA2_/TRDRNA2_187798_c0_seq1.p1  ORF type:complete len:196 (-),score=42.92 gnl/TRDRNA2_/TRDRNA2_187798_c0_seq1:91-609(-)